MTAQRPRYVTQLPRELVTYGGRVGVHSTTLGEPLIPWQLTAANLIGAVDPDRPGSWRYPTVVITVPRQSGKSTLLRAVHMDRLMKPNPDGTPPRKPVTLWMTAQTGQDARKRFTNLADLVDTSSILGALVKRRASVGSEHLRFGRVSLSPFAPTPKALHGETTPFVSVDEAWAFDEASAASLLAAITPTMQNEPGRQLIIISTAGDHASRWLWSLVKAGRASVQDPNSRIAYLECSADPRYADDGDGDPLSLEALHFHPAIGHVTTADDIRTLYDQDQSPNRLANIRRGFLNLWPSDMDTSAEARDLAQFDAATQLHPAAHAGSTVIALDVAHDRSGAAIYAGTPLADGRTLVELVESGPGTAWIGTALGRPGVPGGQLHHDPTGYTGAAIERLTLKHHTPAPASGVDLADATAGLLSAISDGTVVLRAAPELRDQFEAALTRPAGGAGFTWDAAKSPGPIDHLRAATLAHHRANAAALPAISW